MSQQSQIDQWLDRAIALHQRKQTREARPLYEKVLQARPDDPDANHLLGLIDREDGHLTLALERMTKACSLDPENTVLLNNLGDLYRALGRTEDSIETFKAGLAITDKLPPLHNNLGVSYKEIGRHDLAVECFKKALALKPRYAEAYNNLGLSLMASNRLEEATTAFENALAIAPDYIGALGNLGAVLVHRNLNASAVKVLRKALEYGPVAETSNNLGIALIKLQLHAEALKVYDRALEFEPQNGDLLANRAQALSELGRLQEALECLDRALGYDDRQEQIYFLKGAILGQYGDSAGSIAAYKSVLRINPDRAEAYRIISWAGRFEQEDETTAEIRSAYERFEQDSEGRGQLAFALGKIEEDRKNYGRAFDYLVEGNAIRRREFDYSAEETAQRFNRLRALFTPERFERFGAAGHDSAEPIFIVGMPRSGTTLVETIISSHRDVTAGGELTLLGAAAQLAGLSDERFPPTIRLETDADPILKTAEYYLGLVHERMETKGRFTDKMPMNFLYAGLIHLALPKARIIHCRRSPMDTCLSIFKNYFAASGLAFSYDLTELGEYYRLYQQLMRHWDEVMPGAILTLDYEALVADPETETRKLIAHCGLDWDDACLAFHTSKRVVNTASAHQVRRPIYNSSVKLAERYGDALAPLVKALKSGSAPD